MKNPPCNECPKRSETCHSECFDYALYSAMNEVEREKRNKEKEKVAGVYDYNRNRLIKKQKTKKRLGKF